MSFYACLHWADSTTVYFIYDHVLYQDGNIVVVELSKVTAEINPAYSTQIGAQLERVGNQHDHG